MKSIYKILSVLLFGSLIVSCTPTETVGSIVGDWELVALNFTGTSTTTAQGVNFTSTFEGIAKNIEATMTFSENPNKAKSIGSYTKGLKTTTMGTTVNNDVPVNYTSDGTWTKDGLTINLIKSGITSKGTIIELTATTLKLKLEEETVILFEGVTTTTKKTSNLEFKKK